MLMCNYRLQPRSLDCLQLSDAVKADKDCIVWKPLANSMRNVTLCLNSRAGKWSNGANGQWPKGVSPHFVDAKIFVHSEKNFFFGGGGKNSGPSKAWPIRFGWELFCLPDTGYTCWCGIYDMWLGLCSQGNLLMPIGSILISGWYWIIAGGINDGIGGVHSYGLCPIWNWRPITPKSVIGVGR